MRLNDCSSESRSQKTQPLAQSLAREATLLLPRCQLDIVLTLGGGKKQQSFGVVTRLRSQADRVLWQS